MGELFAFNKASVDRIRATTSIVLDGGSFAPGPGGRGRGGAHQVIPAKLTARSSTDKHRYSWAQARNDDGAWTVVPEGLTGAHDSLPAIDLEPGTAPADQTNRFVMLVRGVHADGAEPPKFFPCFYVVPIPPPGALFAVDVAADGGDGDAAPFTYAATSLAGGTLGAGMSPLFDDKGDVIRVAATRGTGYYNAAGAFVLYQVNDVEDVAECDDDDEPHGGTP